MQREDVERLINTVHESKAGRDVRIRTIEGLRALLDRAERAEATAEALREAGLIWAQRVGELEAERDAAFAAGQEEMRERVIGETTPTGAEDATRERIRALPIKPRP